MTATITIDEAGQINLPDALKRVFGVEPGVRLRAEVTSDRIEIVKDIPVVTEGELENGVLVLPKLGIKMDVGAAIRADRDEQAVESDRDWNSELFQRAENRADVVKMTGLPECQRTRQRVKMFRIPVRGPTLTVKSRPVPAASPSDVQPEALVEYSTL